MIHSSERVDITEGGKLFEIRYLASSLREAMEEAVGLTDQGNLEIVWSHGNHLQTGNYILQVGFEETSE